MPTIKTLDERIRARAADELKASIQRLADPLRCCRGIGDVKTRLVSLNDEGKIDGGRLYGAHVLALLVDAIYESTRAAAEDAAVIEFVSRVDNLQSQIDEVRDLTGV